MGVAVLKPRRKCFLESNPKTSMEEMPDTELVAVSKPDSPATRNLLEAQNISLNVNELKRIRDLLGRDPTLLELHIFNTMWSEHCSYKSSKPVLRKYLPTEGPHVVLGPGEDAGIIRFANIEGESYCLVMAHESHNHPSQVLPVEGAATGIGGIVRDVYCMGADVVGVLDPLRFGDPDGPGGARARDIARGVVEGIAQYGNPLGVPNLGGETVFDGSFDDNCLVNVVALGVVPEDSIIRSRVPAEAGSRPYKVILIGKPTDASGFGGAAFASERLSGDEVHESQEAVQIPDPFLKRVLAEGTKKVLEMVREKGIKIGFKDLGAGGISCAVSEMAAAGATGVVIDLDKVNCAKKGMPSEVIACSETQERYAMIAPEEAVAEILRIYNEDYDLPGLYTGAGAFVIGEVTPDKRFKVLHHGKIICNADVDAITTGIEYERKAAKRSRKRQRARLSRDVLKPEEVLLTLLSSDNIAEKEIIYHRYDTEVQGRAVIRPGEADSAVQVFLPGRMLGLAVGIGGNSSVAAADPYMGGFWAVVEAVRNVACVGALPLAITDCLNYGDPEDPGVFWEFSEGVRGVGDACRGLKLGEEVSSGIPVISGNVSFYNQSEKGEAIAPSPIVSCAGRLEDVRNCRGLGFKAVDSKLVFMGKLHENIGGSEFEKLFGGALRRKSKSADEDGYHKVPSLDIEEECSSITAVIEAFRNSLILSAHDVSHGGILVTLAEMLVAGRERKIGCAVDLEKLLPEAPLDLVMHYLFSEYSGIVLEVENGKLDELGNVLKRHNAGWHVIGKTHEGGGMSVDLGSVGGFNVSFDDIAKAQRGNLYRIFS